MTAANVWDLSVTCGMNQRYHQYKLDFWSTSSTAIMVVVAIVALASAILTVASFCRNNRGLGIASLVTSLLSVSVAVALNVIPADTNARFYADMFRRWSDLRQDVDVLQVSADANGRDKPLTPWMLERFNQLLMKKNALNALEPAPNMDLLAQCQEEEERARGLPDLPKQNKPKVGLAAN
jgi:hypothetical protein